MNTKKILPNIIFISCVLLPNFVQPQDSSIVLRNNILLIKSYGIAFLGSGITEQDAKIIATNDAKRKALEQAGIYLESHKTMINDVLVRDEIITFSGSILKTNILNEVRKIINNMFVMGIEIEATIDLILLNERIDEVRENRELEEQLELERKRNKELEAQIEYLNRNIGNETGTDLKKLVNALSATEWNRLGVETKDPLLKIEYHSKAITLDPDYVTAYYNRGSCYNDIQKYNEAIRDFNKALGLNPSYGKAYNNRGFAFNALGQYNLAIEDFNKALKINPQIKTIYSNRGAAYNNQGKYDHAIMDFNKAIEINPEDIMAYNNRGIAYNDLGKYTIAIQDFNKAIELSPDDGTSYYNRGTTYLQIKKYDKAIKDFNKTIELNPDDGASYYNRGSIYYIQKKYKEAIQDYSTVIELNPQNSTCYKNRGFIYMITEQKLNAVNDFNNYLRLEGDKSGDAEEVRQFIRDLGYTPQY